MKKSVKNIIKKAKFFKVKLDERTIITVRTKEALRYWLSEYPSAKVIG